MYDWLAVYVIAVPVVFTLVAAVDNVSVTEVGGQEWWHLGHVAAAAHVMLIATVILAALWLGCAMLALGLWLLTKDERAGDGLADIPIWWLTKVAAPVWRWTEVEWTRTNN